MKNFLRDLKFSFQIHQDLLQSDDFDKYFLQLEPKVRAIAPQPRAPFQAPEFTNLCINKKNVREVVILLLKSCFDET